MEAPPNNRFGQRHITRRHDVRSCAASRVAHHAVVDREPELIHRLGLYADPDDDDVGIDERAVAERTAHVRSRRRQVLDCNAGTQVHAVITAPGDHGPELGAETTHHRLGQGLEQRHRDRAPARGRDLGSDESADHDDLQACREQLAQGERIVEGAEREHTAGSAGRADSKRRTGRITRPS
jgi:hypothetical protein